MSTFERNISVVPDTKIKADSDELAQCYLKDENDNVIVARELWKDHTAVLVFLRHFACAACRFHAEEVWADRAKYESKGAKISFIGVGDTHFIKKFKEQVGITDAPIYTDPSLKIFDAAGFKRGFWIDPGNMHTRPEFISLAIQHTMKKTGSGNVWQLGGILVIKPSGNIVYQYTSQTMDDVPPNKDVVPQVS